MHLYSKEGQEKKDSCSFLTMDSVKFIASIKPPLYSGPIWIHKVTHNLWEANIYPYIMVPVGDGSVKVLTGVRTQIPETVESVYMRLINGQERFFIEWGIDGRCDITQIIEHLRQTNNLT
jgi:hypothetical protein